MNKRKRNLIIIGVVVLILAIILIARMSKKTATKNSASSTTSTIQSEIPKFVQSNLDGFDEGEILNYDGSQYQVIGGKWELIS